MLTNHKEPITVFNIADGAALGVLRCAHLDPTTREIVAIGVELSHENAEPATSEAPASEPDERVLANNHAPNARGH